MIGREFDDPEFQSDIKNWPFSVIEEDDQVKICVEYKGEQKKLYPEEILAAVLAKMRASAEAFLGGIVTDAVITIPAYFNNVQRTAVMDAAAIAGLNVLHLITEPTAAVIAYKSQLTDDERPRKNVLVFDFGRSSCDVSIVKMKGSDFKVRAVTGDSHLGGEDFDACLVEFFVEEFKCKFEQDITHDKEVLSQVKAQCKQAKHTLSSAKLASVHLEGTNLEGSITRARFEDVCDDLFEKSVQLVYKVLKEAEISKEEIDEVVLVG